MSHNPIMGLPPFMVEVVAQSQMQIHVNYVNLQFTQFMTFLEDLQKSFLVKEASS